MKKPPTLKISDKIAGGVARDLKAVFEYLQAMRREDLLTGSLLMLMETLIQQQARHRAAVEAKQRKLAASTPADEPDADLEEVDWVPPEPPEPTPKGAALDINGAPLLL